MLLCNRLKTRLNVKRNNYEKGYCSKWNTSFLKYLFVLFNLQIVLKWRLMTNWSSQNSLKEVFLWSNHFFNKSKMSIRENQWNLYRAPNIQNLINFVDWQNNILTSTWRCFDGHPISIRNETCIHIN